MSRMLVVLIYDYGTVRLKRVRLFRISISGFAGSKVWGLGFWVSERIAALSDLGSGV